MFVKVIFHGALKKICPDVYKVDANTPAEAIRGITNQFRDKLIRKDGHRFVCSVKECPSEIQLNSGFRTDEINIFPAFCASGGGGNGGMTQIIVGAVIIGLVALAIVLTGGVGALTFAAMTSGMAGFFTGMGASMIMLGLCNMLFGQDTTKGATDNPESSRTFGNNGNTTKIGTRIPIGYGIYRLAGQYLSVNTQAIDRNGGVSSGFTS